MNSEIYLCAKRSCRHPYTNEQQIQVPAERISGFPRTEGRCPKCHYKTFYLLDADDLKVLWSLGKVIGDRTDANSGGGEFEFTHFSPELNLLKEGFNYLKIETHLKRLKRFGLVASRGRGRYAMYWITANGHAARSLRPQS